MKLGSHFVVPDSVSLKEKYHLFRLFNPSDVLVKPSNRVLTKYIRLSEEVMRMWTTPYNQSLLPPRETGDLMIIKELTARMNRWSRIPENETLSGTAPFRDHYRIVFAITADVPEWEVDIFVFILSRQQYQLKSSILYYHCLCFSAHIMCSAFFFLFRSHYSHLLSIWVFPFTEVTSTSYVFPSL